MNDDVRGGHGADVDHKLKHYGLSLTTSPIGVCYRLLLID